MALAARVGTAGPANTRGPANTPGTAGTFGGTSGGTSGGDEVTRAGAVSVHMSISVPDFVKNWNVRFVSFACTSMAPKSAL
jgi:hypothetical protein